MFLLIKKHLFLTYSNLCLVCTNEYVPSEKHLYYHLRSTVKRDHFFAKVYFSNVDGLDSNLSRFDQ